MALANGQKVLAGPGLPHNLQFVWGGVNIVVPSPTTIPNYLVVSSGQYAQLLTDSQFTTLVAAGRITVSTNLPTTYQQQQYAALTTIQAQLSYLKALVITLGGPTFS